MFDYDLFVIGAGSGGVRAARMAAGLGARVAIAEDRDLGGTCVNVGCVPKKLFVYGSHFAEDFAQASAFGWKMAAPPEFDWPTLIANKNSEIARLNCVYKNLLENSGVTLINGRARLLDGHRIEVAGQTYSAERILIATGGWPFVPEFSGSEHVISSNEAFFLEDFPRRVVVVGGGYIALEFAGIFNGLGAATELLYRRDLFLRGFDQDVREFVRDQMRGKGVGLHFNADVERVEKQANDSLHVYLHSGEVLAADLVLYATGRKPNIADLGLEALGVELRDDGAVKVDEFFQTSVPSVYALGDVIGRIQLTPVALAEAMALVRHLYQHDSTPLDYDNIPSAVFCQPNIATVGLTEEQARKKHGNVDIYRSSFRPLKQSITGSHERCLMKMIVDRETDRVLGVHMVGAEAGEVIQGIAIAMKAGATKSVFDQTIGIHPTSAEEFVSLREPD